MAPEAATRPGYAELRIGGIRFTASNFHVTNRELRWLTGIFSELRSMRDPDYRTWFIEAALLGFSIGVGR